MGHRFHSADAWSPPREKKKNIPAVTVVAAIVGPVFSNLRVSPRESVGLMRSSLRGTLKMEHFRSSHRDKAGRDDDDGRRSINQQPAPTQRARARHLKATTVLLSFVFDHGFAPAGSSISTLGREQSCTFYTTGVRFRFSIRLVSRVSSPPQRTSHQLRKQQCAKKREGKRNKRKRTKKCLVGGRNAAISIVLGQWMDSSRHSHFRRT
jgi:hypothetical protein